MVLTSGFVTWMSLDIATVMVPPVLAAPCCDWAGFWAAVWLAGASAVPPQADRIVAKPNSTVAKVRLRWAMNLTPRPGFALSYRVAQLLSGFETGYCLLRRTGQ